MTDHNANIGENRDQTGTVTGTLTNKELAAQMIGQLETLGADWAKVVRHVPSIIRRTEFDPFAQQVLKPMEDLMREAARRLGEKP